MRMRSTWCPSLALRIPAPVRQPPIPPHFFGPVNFASRDIQTYQSYGAEAGDENIIERRSQKPVHYQLLDPALSLSLRKALDSFAQDLLDMASYLSKTKQERQRQLDRKNVLGQAFRRASNEEHKQRLEEDFATVNMLIQNIEADLIQAKRQGLPDAESRFFLRLKRIHGRLPVSKAHKVLTNSRSTNKAILRENMRLTLMLSIPTADVLSELANHLLTSSLPFVEDSFIIMLRKLRQLRYPSMARSAYYHLLSAGYVPPDNPKEIPPLLKIASSIHDTGGFHSLARSVRRWGITLDNHVYEALVVGYLKLCRETTAMEGFRAMLSDHIQPRLSLLTRILHDCGTRRDWERGKEIWRMIKIRQREGDLIPDKWAYYEMWRLCKRCAKYYIAENIRLESLEQGADIGEIVKRPLLRGLPVRRSNKRPQLLHYRDSFTRQNFNALLSDNVLLRRETRLRRQLIDWSSKLAREKVEYVVLRRQQQLRGCLVHLDATVEDKSPEPFNSPNMGIQTLVNIHQALRDEETFDILDEALAEYLHHTRIAETLLRPNVLYSQIAARNRIRDPEAIRPKMNRGRPL